MTFSEFLLVDELITGLAQRLNESILDDWGVLARQPNDAKKFRALTLLLAYVNVESGSYGNIQVNDIFYSDRPLEDKLKFIENKLKNHPEHIEAAKNKVKTDLKQNTLWSTESKIYKFFSNKNRLPYGFELQDQY